MAEPKVSLHMWTSRKVVFTPFPGELFDDLLVLEALSDHYWERPAAWIRRLVEPVMGASGVAFEVSGLPWWMPAWWARRTVVRIFAGLGIAGDATCLTLRTALQM